MEYKIENLSHDEIKKLIGVNDNNLKLLSSLYHCDIVFRNDTFVLLKDDNELSNKFSKHLDFIISNINNDIDYDFIKHSFENINDQSFMNEIIGYSINGKPIKCKTYNQYNLVNSVIKSDLTFAIGPAGTGKTFLAVLLACNSYKKGDVNKIIITRPAVEAGESLGFLPGDLKEKIDPYLMPIYDALDIILGKENKDKLVEKGIIEIIPLAYMRGRTLDNSFIILDEAQNTTVKQILMFLTRFGYNSKMLVNGDITQIDLKIAKKDSGLVIAKEKLKDIENISIVEFNNNDVVRNPLVQKIIERFIENE